MVTQRQIGRLTQVLAEYSDEDDDLRMTFPDGSVVGGRPQPGRETATVLWGRVVSGVEIDGGMERGAVGLLRDGTDADEVQKSGSVVSTSIRCRLSPRRRLNI